MPIGLRENNFMFCFGHKLTSFTYSAKMNKTTKSVTNLEYTLQKCLSWIIFKWDFCQNQPNLHNYHNLQNYKLHNNHCNTILKQDILCVTQDKFGKHKSRGFREYFWKKFTKDNRWWQKTRTILWIRWAKT